MAELVEAACAAIRDVIVQHDESAMHEELKFPEQV